MIQLFWLGFALAASPGPDFFLIAHHTISSGRFIGYATLLGNRLSLCIHISLAVLGLAIALQKSPQLFLVIRILGGVYLIYLGARKLYERYRRTGDQRNTPASDSITARVAFRRGFFNNLLNPKVTLFFLSLFPQFANHEVLTTSPWTVGLFFFLGNTLWWIPLVSLVGESRVRMQLQRIQIILDILFGLLFIGFGGQIIWELLGA